MPSPEPTRTRVFVYGTLRRGQPAHDFLAKQRFVGEARTIAAFELVDLGAYPGLVRGGETSVVGEVWAVDDSTLARLDRYEGHPHLYLRQAIVLHSGETAQAYVMAAEQARGRAAIPGGDWVAADRKRGPL